MKCFSDFFKNTCSETRECPCLKSYFNMMCKHENILSNSRLGIEARLKDFIAQVRVELLLHWNSAIEAKCTPANPAGQ